MENIKLKWKIINHTKFISEHGEYEIVVEGSKWWLWRICKEGYLIDAAQYHSPTHNELSAKIQAEKCFNEIIKL